MLDSESPAKNNLLLFDMKDEENGCSLSQFK